MENIKVAIVGLGYVGLPLAVAFAKKYNVIGYDIDVIRIKKLQEGKDDTLEVEPDQLNKVLNNKDKLIGLTITNKLSELSTANVYIITVPTPVDEFKQPNLEPLKAASLSIGSLLKEGDYVIYESTVYPGCTEEICIPILEAASGMKLNKNLNVGYSPERVNPGDKVKTLEQIKKVTSGSSPQAAIFIDELYQKIILAGTHLAPSIKVAEASKAIENAQRDVNISFVNELALIFDKLGIDTSDVLAAAATKWNFLNFKPGLVGGHCIGVDPYYLAYKAQSVGYHPDVILSGRRVNDQIGVFVAQKVIKLMIQKNQQINGAKVLILGITFKENCPDTRNTKVIDVIEELEGYGVDVAVCDPWVSKKQVIKDYGINVMSEVDYQQKYDAIVLAVAHNQFLSLEIPILLKENGVVFDTKSVIKREWVNGRL